MRWRDALSPTPMTRVALVAPQSRLREVLVRVADAGVIEFERVLAPGDAPAGEAMRRLQRTAAPAGPARLSQHGPDLEQWERAGRSDLLAGEAQLAGHAAEAVRRDDVAALLGWAPSDRIGALAARLADLGGAVASLPAPRGIQPPTATSPDPLRAGLAPLVSTYTTVPYADVDPTVLAGLAYVVMFGAMFGDVGHGALLVLGALAIRRARPQRLARLQPYWRFVAGAGLFSMLFGLLYGECFGPTGLVPTLWLAPMDHPVPLLLAGVGLGAVLLAGAYALGTVNRVRESGWPVALTAPSGLAGSALFLAAGLGVAAWYLTLGWLALIAVLLALTGLVLAFAGLLAEAGGGVSGTFQALMETLDVVIRLGANAVSFARLAAFGLTHAVLSGIVWAATAGLWQRGVAGAVAAVAVFAVGNALAFSLEALVAGVQALRLEYYELFSRVFQGAGRPFRPWHVPTDTIGDAPCPPG
ncbi:V-type ATPase 116kDa subunit family protein [Actinoplanes sp. NPDC048967]|uniref:V-type ATPase 116kDa subunit family protein n=1 Tax=Actinoplanes sp. NPDC048967 TaxID=3155269 RepID=UPI003401A16C